MKNIYLIFIGALAFICVFLFFSKSCSDTKHDKQLLIKDKMIDDCLNAPIRTHTDTVHNYLTDTIFLTYRYKVTDTVKVSDAIDWKNGTVEQRQYSGTYSHPQFDVNWSAKVTGTLDELTINPPSLIKSLVITKERTVDLTQYQTPQSTIKGKAGLYATMGVCTDFKAVNALDLNLMYIGRRGFGLLTGVQTDFAAANFRAGLVLKLK